MAQQGVSFHSTVGATRRRGRAPQLHLTIITWAALPLALIAFALRKYLKQRGAKPATAAKPVKPTPKPKPAARRDYKLSQPVQQQQQQQRQQSVTKAGSAADTEGVEELDAAASQQGMSEILMSGEQMDAAGGGQNFINMLQSLGYKVVMPKDGSSDKVYLVPPGGEGEGADAIPEGEEGEEDYDEDEEPEQ
mmetsp:Transcript_2284/g.3783  ORF Transcript_2284/g.3783 Transcript_2284/m.3783 type:complete len:192 (+) Transcript_2284:24-599(+)